MISKIPLVLAKRCSLVTLLFCKGHQLRLEVDEPRQKCLRHQLEIALLWAVVNPE